MTMKTGTTGSAAAMLGMALLCGWVGSGPAAAQKSGGTLRIYNSSNPPSASLHEETTIAVRDVVLGRLQ